MILLIGLLGVASICRAADAAPPALSAESLLWDKSLSLRAGLGYTDNALLSSVVRQESAFLATGLDATLLRLPIDGPEFYMFLTGDDSRYLRDVGVAGEQTLAAVSKLKVSLGADWQAALAVEYFYQDQVVDVSTTEADLTTVALRGHLIKLAPAFERRLSEHNRLQWELAFGRQHLQKPLDPYWEGGPKITFEHAYGRKSVLSLSYEFNLRTFDERVPADEWGAELPGSSLVFTQHHLEVADRHYWDAQRRWRTDTRVGLQLNLDNGSGFFDFTRYQLSQQVRYTTDVWALRAQARLGFYDYSVQRAVLNESRRRQLVALNWTVRGERKLTRSWKCFVEFEQEQDLSNRPATGYRANVVLVGLEWEL